LTCEGFTKYGIIKFLEHSVTCSFICIMWVDAAFVASISSFSLNPMNGIPNETFALVREPSFEDFILGY